MVISKDYIPRWLPCGKKVNEYIIRGKIQCCSTECPEKSNKEIKLCYRYHKSKILKLIRKLKIDLSKYSWLEIKDALFESGKIKFKKSKKFF